MLKFILAALALTAALSTTAYASCGPNESLVSTCSSEPEAGEEFWNEWNCKRYGICKKPPGYRENPWTVWCTAKDNRGQVYRVWGKRSLSKSTQVRALEKCQTESRTAYSCRAIGCSLVR